jgi:putative tryptophan/tyrosine transport system substrate-binding protein
MVVSLTRSALAIVVALVILAAPLVAEAQRVGNPPRIGFLGTGASGPAVEAFRAGLRGLGWVEGQNIILEFRWAEGDFDRLPKLAAELVGLKVEIIVTASTPAIRAVQHATKTIPIVMASSADAVSTGLVVSLARPGGNTTGMTVLIPELSAKRLEVLKEAIPKASRVGVLWNSTAGPAGQLALDEMQSAAGKLGLHLRPIDVRRPDEIETAVSMIAKDHAEALLIIEGPLLIQHRTRVIDMAARNRLPTVAPLREFAEAGGLIAYGPSLVDTFRHAARYVDKILKGAQPGDLPVEQPTRFELVINLKTANALGLTIPQALLLRADEVIR